MIVKHDRFSLKENYIEGISYAFKNSGYHSTFDKPASAFEAGFEDGVTIRDFMWRTKDGLEKEK